MVYPRVPEGPKVSGDKLINAVKLGMRSHGLQLLPRMSVYNIS